MGPQTRTTIVLDLDDDPDPSGWTQPLAGSLVWSRRPLIAGAWRFDRPQRAPTPWPQTAAWTMVYDGPGLVDGGLQPIRSLVASGGERRIDFADGESFLVSAQGGVIRRRSASAAPASSLERALGAPLAVALALHGVHLLHASAVVQVRPSGQRATPSGALAFTAPSGTGKSTLAAAAPALPGATWQRIADDQLPVLLERSALALPHFPQLKLEPGAGYPASAPGALPLAGLFEIDHSPDAAGIELQRLSPRAACLVLTRATVAARLFDATLLARHFDACATAGAALPVYRLRYPSGLDLLPAVWAAIEREATPGPDDAT